MSPAAAPCSSLLSSKKCQQKIESRSFEPPKIQKTATKGYELITWEKTRQS